MVKKRICEKNKMNFIGPSLCLLPCCRPGAGQCSCSHPGGTGQLWLCAAAGLHTTIKTSMKTLRIDMFYNVWGFQSGITHMTHGKTLTYCTTLAIIGSHHQCRTPWVVHGVDVSSVPQNQLQPSHVLGNCGRVKRGPGSKMSQQSFIW